MTQPTYTSSPDMFNKNMKNIFCDWGNSGVCEFVGRITEKGKNFIADKIGIGTAIFTDENNAINFVICKAKAKKSRTQKTPVNQKVLMF